MKTLKIMMAIAAVAMAFILTGCTKEDNGGDPFPNVKNGWTESGNTMTYKTSVTNSDYSPVVTNPNSQIPSISTKSGESYTLYYLFTFKFDGEACTSAVWELGCPNADLAAEILAELKIEWADEPELEEVLKLIKVSGRVIKIDLTSIFSLIPKSLIKEIVEEIVNEF